jgi:hypothetical protein
MGLQEQGCAGGVTTRGFDSLPGHATGNVIEMMYSGPYYLPRSYRPYGQHTYADIGGPDGYLARLETFAGCSMRGGWERDGNGRRLFCVYSFDTRIAYCYEHGLPRVSPATYGRTTSRHQNLCSAWLGVAHIHPPTLDRAA